jgi:hypothetical protein
MVLNERATTAGKDRLPEREFSIGESQEGIEGSLKGIVDEGAPKVAEGEDHDEVREDVQEAMQIEAPERRSSSPIVTKESPSPVTQKSRSPVRMVIRNKKSSPLVRNKKSVSPIINKSPSPVRNKSPSPVRNSRSPSLARTNRSPSPVRNSRSPSPVSRKSPSPVKKSSDVCKNDSVSPEVSQDQSPSRFCSHICSSLFTLF